LPDIFTEQLARFKQNEKPESVLIIADNPELIRIVVAWSNLDVRSADELSTFSGVSCSEVWSWLWENSRYNLTELKVRASVPYSESILKQKIDSLIGNRVLYPDGTVNSFVQRYLRTQVARLFEAKVKKTAKPKQSD